MKKAMFSSVVVIVLAVVILGLSVIFIKQVISSVELPDLNKNMPAFFKMMTYPEQGQTGTVFNIKLQLVNKSGIYRIDARVIGDEGSAGTFPLFDDGSHGDEAKDDGIYANVFDSTGKKDGIYRIDIVINPSEKQLVFENSSVIKIFGTKCEPIIYNGNPSDKIDITIIPYKYTDLGKFRKEAVDLIRKGIMSYGSFSDESKKINFYIVNQSEELGCKRDKTTGVLVNCNDARVQEVASQCPSDSIIVLIDDKDFCGAASSYVRVCNGWNPEQVAVHELGHSFAGLGDEYVYSSAYPGLDINEEEYPNCDIFGCEKWDYLEGVKCLKGCGFDSKYRASDSCIMKKYTDHFCPVCNEQIIRLFANYENGETQNMPAPPAGKAYAVGLGYKDESIYPEKLYLTESTAPDRKNSDGKYTAKIISFSGKEIYSFRFYPENSMFIDAKNESEGGKILLEQNSWMILAPYSNDAKRIEFYEQNKKLFSFDVGYLSETCGNGKCESHESAFDCPQDCSVSAKDDLCNYAKDGICDPDCRNLDSDCRETNWAVIAGIFAALIIFIIALLQKKKK